MARHVRRGNPSKLTKRQHVLARKSVERFAGADGRVEVWFREHGEVQRCRPDHSTFWTYRAWDQPSERNTERQIEGPFQALAETILKGKRQLFSEDQRLITRFQQLWALRFAVKEYPRTDVGLPSGVPPGRELTQAERENLEANNYSFVTGSRLPGPQLAGLLINAGLLRLARSEAANTEWSVVESHQIEFVVPDSFRTIRTVPLSPKCCLMAIPGGARELSPFEAMHVNNMAVLQCVHYAFARDFTKTGVAFPIPPHAQPSRRTEGKEPTGSRARG